MSASRRKIRVIGRPANPSGWKWQWWCPCCATGHWLYPEHYPQPPEDVTLPGWRVMWAVRHHIDKRHKGVTE